MLQNHTMKMHYNKLLQYQPAHNSVMGHIEKDSNLNY